MLSSSEESPLKAAVVWSVMESSVEAGRRVCWAMLLSKSSWSAGRTLVMAKALRAFSSLLPGCCSSCCWTTISTMAAAVAGTLLLVVDGAGSSAVLLLVLLLLLVVASGGPFFVLWVGGLLVVYGGSASVYGGAEESLSSLDMTSTVLFFSLGTAKHIFRALSLGGRLLHTSATGVYGTRTLTRHQLVLFSHEKRPHTSTLRPPVPL